MGRKVKYLLETPKYGLLFRRIPLENALKANWKKIKQQGWNMKFTVPPHYLEIYKWVKKEVK